MKERIKNIIIGLLFMIGIALVSFSVYGLLTHTSGFGLLDFGFKAESTNSEKEIQEKQTGSDPKSDFDESTEIQDTQVMKQGDNPEVDDKIKAELLRIEHEFALWSDYPVNQKYYMEKGYHSASFTNPTGIDFSNITFYFSFQDDYGNELASQIMYDAPLKSGETITLPLEIDKSDIYGNGEISWEYEL